jgi:hypothetical protein
VLPIISRRINSSIHASMTANRSISRISSIVVQYLHLLITYVHMTAQLTRAYVISFAAKHAENDGRWSLSNLNLMYYHQT